MVNLKTWFAEAARNQKVKQYQSIAPCNSTATPRLLPWHRGARGFDAHPMLPVCISCSFCYTIVHGNTFIEIIEIWTGWFQPWRVSQQAPLFGLCFGISHLGSHLQTYWSDMPFRLATAIKTWTTPARSARFSARVPSSETDDDPCNTWTMRHS